MSGRGRRLGQGLHGSRRPVRRCRCRDLLASGGVRGSQQSDLARLQRGRLPFCRTRIACRHGAASRPQRARCGRADECRRQLSARAHAFDGAHSLCGDRCRRHRAERRAGARDRPLPRPLARAVRTACAAHARLPRRRGCRADDRDERSSRDRERRRQSRRQHAARAAHAPAPRTSRPAGLRREGSRLRGKNPGNADRRGHRHIVCAFRAEAAQGRGALRHDLSARERRRDPGRLDRRRHRELGGADRADAWRGLRRRHAGSFLAAGRPRQGARGAQGHGACRQGHGRDRPRRDPRPGAGRSRQGRPSRAARRHAVRQSDSGRTSNRRQKNKGRTTSSLACSPACAASRDFSRVARTRLFEPGYEAARVASLRPKRTPRAPGRAPRECARLTWRLLPAG